MKDTIVLCGFMSSGKTTVGQALAKQLGYDFVDTDALLVQQHGMTIREMFDKGGETYFRDCEHETIRTVAAMENKVVSTGGGVMTFERNAALLAEKTTVVYIRRDFERCYAAIARHPERPLMKNKTKAEIRAMYDSREAAYAKYAHITIENNGSVGSAVQELIAKLQK